MAERKLTRRRWLTACSAMTAGVATVAGCSSSGTDETTTEDDPARNDEGEYGSWPMIHYDAANRLSVPHDGVDGEPEILWTAELEGSVQPPVVYDDTAFVGHDFGTYSAVDLEDGEIVWEHETDGWRAPAVSESAVFVAGDGVEALDRDDGDVLWRTGHDETVESLRIHDGAIYAGLESRVLALDEDGEELLEFETPPTVQSLAIDDERIYVRSRPDEDEDDFVMAAYDRDTNDQLWEHEISHEQQWFDDRVTRTFPVVDGTVYTVTDEAVISIDGATGDLAEVVEPDDFPWTRPSLHDGVVYLQRGSMAYEVDSGDTPPEWDPAESADTPFVVAGDVGYTISAGVLSPPRILVVDQKTGDVSWDIEAPEQKNFHVPVVLNEMILVPINDPGLVALG